MTLGDDRRAITLDVDDFEISRIRLSEAKIVLRPSMCDELRRGRSPSRSPIKLSVTALIGRRTSFDE